MTAAAVRPFGFWTASALVVGGMIGSGIFVLPSQLAPYGWSGAAAWLAAVPGALLIALVLARLAAAMPDASGAVAICGRVLGPLPGVLVGWAYWVGIWSANAVIALTAIRYLGSFWPGLTATPLGTASSAVALLWLLTALNLQGARAAGRFQVVTTLLKLLPLVAVVLILATLLGEGGSAFAGATRAGFRVADITPALAPAFFALVGFESASVAAERVRDPARNVVRATMTGLVLVSMLYVVISCGVAFALPMTMVRDADAPLAMFVAHFWGSAAGLAVAGFAAVAAIGCLNGWVLLQGELPLGMSRSGLLPRWIGATSRRDVPVGALLIASGLASVLILSNASRSTGALLDFMLRLTTAATLWLYVGACLSALRLGVARVPAVLGLAFAAWVMLGSGVEAVLLSIVLMLTAVPLYLLRPRSSAEQPAEQAAIA